MMTVRSFDNCGVKVTNCGGKIKTCTNVDLNLNWDRCMSLIHRLFKYLNNVDKKDKYYQQLKGTLEN